ncbi:MAG: 4-alpha-glucanotransferase [Defluviitaleaceae bacterium]|nr:4-alpha-glucanotransferase [Defluviitaleaceae bacterium]
MTFTRTSGVLLHISSLHTNFGIGDLGKCAYDFIDFLKEGQQTIWQILPINPTSFGDSPYSCFSSFAGNPLFICPDMLVEQGFCKPEDIAHDIIFPESIVDYGLVINLKTRILRAAHKNGAHNDCEKFLSFKRKNSKWLNDYSLFMALKEYFIKERAGLPNDTTHSDDYFYGAVWQTWPQYIAARKSDAIQWYKDILAEEIDYHNFLQFLFYEQYADLKAYAGQNGIKIMGDLPIFAAYDSADCWANKKLFKLDLSTGKPTAVAGVPPDYFAKNGQLWGNPLYNWEAIKMTGYRWWIARIKAAMECFDILRFDHFRGFESYWAIPYGEKTAKNGKWLPGPGRGLFDAIKKELGDLPLVAEDLGIITPAVEKLLNALGLPGMKVLQFAFDTRPENTHLPHNFKTDNMVVYTGTHDNDTTQGWYNTAPEAWRDHFRRYLNSSGQNAADDLTRAAFLSIAKIALIPAQDLLGLDSPHRTNTPGIPSGNWQFRLAKNQLTNHHAQNLAYLSKLSNRNLSS